MQNFEISTTRCLCENSYSRKCYSKVFTDDSKALKTLEFSDWLFCLHNCTKKCIDFCNGDFRALIFVPLCRLHLKNFLGLLNHTLLSSETFSGILFFYEHRIIEILKFCTQTGSVRNG